jgi:hypothetical protein
VGSKVHKKWPERFVRWWLASSTGSGQQSTHEVARSVGQIVVSMVYRYWPEKCTGSGQNGRSVGGYPGLQVVGSKVHRKWPERSIMLWLAWSTGSGEHSAQEVARTVGQIVVSLVYR